MRSYNITPIIFIAIFITLIVGTFCIPRTNEDEARAALEASGFTEIEMTGFEPWMLGRDDFYSTGFSAKAPNGNRVDGAVTGGIFKGSTIRFK